MLISQQNMECIISVYWCACVAWLWQLMNEVCTQCYLSFSFPPANVGCSRTPPVFSSYSTILSSSCPKKFNEFQRNLFQVSPQKPILSYPDLSDPVAILIDSKSLLQVEAIDVARDAFQHPFIRPASQRDVFNSYFTQIGTVIT